MKGHEFTIIRDLYEEDEEKNLVLIRKNVRNKWFCDNLNDIDIEEAYSERGYKRPNRVLVSHKEKGMFVVVGNFDDIKRLKMLNTHTTVKGFR